PPLSWRHPKALGLHLESNTPDTEKTPQFVMLTHDWIESWLPKLSGSALKVYVALRYHSDRSGRKAYPSYNLLHRETGLCREAIAKALADLESQRIITVNRAPKRVNHYRFPPVKSSSEIEPPGSETRPENSGSLVRKPDQSSSEIELNLVRKPDGNHSKEPDKATKNKEPPTTAGVHRHWNTLIASNVKAEIPPKPVVYPQEEWFAKSKEEQTRLTKYRIEWYEKYGTNDD
ncbi:hypothetical protein LCGC14_1944640, partial [marine sediment metagenome]